MAGITVQIRRNMRRFLAFGKCAVMTSATASPHLIVIDFCRWGPAALTVAAITGVRRINVSRALTFGTGSIMTD